MEYAQRYYVIEGRKAAKWGRTQLVRALSKETLITRQCLA